MKNMICLILALVALSLMSACGGSTQSPKADRIIKAVIKPSALSTGQNIAGINLTITVPAGVEPPLLLDGKADPTATVEITSSAPQNQTLPGATFTPATTSAPGQLAIIAVIAAGFQTNDLITLHLKVAAGTFPVVEDFKLLSFEAFDINGTPVSGLTPTLTTTIQ